MKSLGWGSNPTGLMSLYKVEEIPGVYVHRGKATGRHSEKVAIYKL